MEESPFINKINPHMKHLITEEFKVVALSLPENNRTLSTKQHLLGHIISKASPFLSLYQNQQ